MAKQNKKKKTSIMLAFFMGIILIMILGVFLFIYHRDQPFVEWSIGYWGFIISVFSALFAGLNVVVFYQLTIAVENQNDERQKEALLHDVVKYKHAYQQQLYDDFVKMHHPYDFELLKREQEDWNHDDIDRVEKILYKSISLLQTLKNSTSIFPSIAVENIDEMLAIYTEWNLRNNKGTIDYLQCDDAEKSKKILQKHLSNIISFGSNNSMNLNVQYRAILGQMRYDIQATLCESLSQPAPPKPEKEIYALSAEGVRTVRPILQKRIRNELPYSQPDWDYNFLTFSLSGEKA